VCGAICDLATQSLLGFATDQDATETNTLLGTRTLPPLFASTAKCGRRNVPSAGVGDIPTPALSISAGTAQWHSASARKFQRECLRDAVLRSFLYFGLKAKGHQMSISGLHGHMFPEETRHGGSSADGCLPPADGSAVRAHGQRKR